MTTSSYNGRTEDGSKDVRRAKLRLTPEAEKLVGMGELGREPLSGNDAIRFLNRMAEADQHKVGFVPTPKLANLKNLLPENCKDQGSSFCADFRTEDGCKDCPRDEVPQTPAKELTKCLRRSGAKTQSDRLTRAAYNQGLDAQYEHNSLELLPVIASWKLELARKDKSYLDMLTTSVEALEAFALLLEKLQAGPSLEELKAVLIGNYGDCNVRNGADIVNLTDIVARKLQKLWKEKTHG